MFSCGHDLPVHRPWLPCCQAPAVPGRAAHPRDKGKQVPSPSASLKGRVPFMQDNEFPPATGFKTKFQNFYLLLFTSGTVPLVKSKR